ncbi:MAG: AMP-binding protein, partial [Porticoccaceae bacterium]|nr:AMP-binding protein [Porticoccaceae bacterium]
EPFATVALDDLAILQYTGGTTGPSKGAMLSHRNLLASAVQATSALEQDDEDEIIIAPMPLYHIYGFTWNLVSNVLTGSRSVLIPNPRDITGLLTTMRGLRFTSFAGVNTLFAGLMAHPDFDSIDFSRLKGSIAGGAALVSSIADEWQRRTGSNIFEGYGLSETAASLSCNTPHNNQLGTVGKAFVGTELKVVDDQGRELATGQSGELLVRGPQVLSGYWNRPDIDAIDSEGWFRTGDIAIMQADGYIKIVDRIKDMILVSGFNVYPNEVEDVLTSHPGVFECAAVAVPDERTGEAVKVFVVRCSSELTEEALRDFSRENLAAYKVPKHIVFVKDLPKSAVGKVLRRELRDGTAAAHNS